MKLWVYVVANCILELLGLLLNIIVGLHINVDVGLLGVLAVFKVYTTSIEKFNNETVILIINLFVAYLREYGA